MQTAFEKKINLRPGNLNVPLQVTTLKIQVENIAKSKYNVSLPPPEGRCCGH